MLFVLPCAMAGTAKAVFTISLHNDRHNSGCTIAGARPKQALVYPTQHSFFESDVADLCGVSLAFILQLRMRATSSRT